MQKQANPRWSYASWAKVLGFNSHATLSMIISGQRNPGKKVIDAFADYFKFNGQEEHYFAKLVSIQKSVKDPNLSVILVDKYLEIEKKGESDNIFDWLINIDSAILCQVIKLPDFELSADWFKRRLNYKLSQPLELLVEKLKTYNILTEEEEGRLSRSQQLVITTTPSQEQIRDFHLSALKMIGQAYDHISPDEGIFGTLTFNMRKEDIAAYRQKLQEMHRQLVAEFEDDDGEESAMVNYNFFPVTHSTDN